MLHRNRILLIGAGGLKAKFTNNEDNNVDNKKTKILSSTHTHVFLKFTGLKKTDK